MSSQTGAIGRRIGGGWGAAPVTGKANSACAGLLEASKNPLSAVSKQISYRRASSYSACLKWNSCPTNTKACPDTRWRCGSEIRWHDTRQWPQVTLAVAKSRFSNRVAPSMMSLRGDRRIDRKLTHRSAWKENSRKYAQTRSNICERITGSGVWLYSPALSGRG